MAKRRALLGKAAAAEDEPEAELREAALQLSSDEEDGQEFDINSGEEEDTEERDSASGDDDDDEGDTDSDGDGEGEEEEEEDEEAKAAIAEYYRAARDDDDSDGADEAGGGGDEEEAVAGAVGELRPEDGDETDSSEDERPSRNTIGNVPLKWYKHEDHIGYDREGGKLIKKKQRDKLEEHMARQDGGKAWRTIYDEYNDEEIVLSKEELKMIQRIRMGKFPHLEVDPFPEYNDFFTRETQIHPVLNLPEPKRRFVRSKWEEKKVVKLVRAMRKGWLKRQTKKEGEEEEEAPLYLMWEDDNKVSEKTAVGLSYIPPPKPQLPSHEQSYNPPQEYLPNDEERQKWEEADEEDRAKFLPQQFECLRKVPMYANYIQERFERCLDMYLCPRTRKKRIHIDPESLVPKLPKPTDLQPFPVALCLEFLGHSAKVNSLSVDPTGQWLLSGSSDCTLRVWEVQSGRCSATWKLPSAVSSVGWCPNAMQSLVAATAGNSVFLLPSGVRKGGLAEGAFHRLEGLETPEDGPDEGEAKPLVRWQAHGEGGVELVHNFPVKSVTWHTQGDYFATVAPTGNTQAVVVHQLSKRKSQNPFRKNRGRVQFVKFHPSKPFFFVATSNHVRVYNLAKQSLTKKLIGGSGVITSLDVHSGGDNIIVGCEDNRLMWFDMDLSTKPYRALKYHNQPIRGVAYHRSYPLFATSSDDGTVQVFHGMVYSDLMTNPLIVPVKILRGHKVVNFQGVLDCKFHPTQPWLFSAGADHSIKMWCN